MSLEVMSDKWSFCTTLEVIVNCFLFYRNAQHLEGGGQQQACNTSIRSSSSLCRMSGEVTASSTTSSGGLPNIQNHPSASSDSGCALEEYTWVPQGLRPQQVSYRIWNRVRSNDLEKCEMKSLVFLDSHTLDYFFWTIWVLFSWLTKVIKLC